MGSLERARQRLQGSGALAAHDQTRESHPSGQLGLRYVVYVGPTVVRLEEIIHAGVGPGAARSPESLSELHTRRGVKFGDLAASGGVRYGRSVGSAPNEPAR